MPVRRLTSLLAALLLIAGLSALPTASLARPTSAASLRQADDPTQTDDTSTDDQSTDDSADLSDEDLANLDDSCATDGGSAGDTTDDNFGDDTATDDGTADDPGADTRQADDPSTDDTSTDDTTTDDTSTDDTTTDDGSLDDTSTDPCATELTDDEVLSDVGDGDVTDLGKKGAFGESFDMPGPGTIDETLTGGAGSRAVIAKVRIVGSAHKKVVKAGTVTVRVKLTKLGRKLVRSSKRTLRLTLNTRIALDSGRTIKRSKTLNVKPKKKPAKGKHKKPAKHKKP